MTTTPPEAPENPAPQPDPATTGTRPRVHRDEISDLTRLRRTVGPDRVVAGVGGGIARHLDIDPIIVRILLVVFTFVGGAGLLVYAACWLFVPEEGSDRSVWEISPRNRNALLIVVAVVALVFATGATFGQHFPWPLGIIALAVIAWLALRDRSGSTAGPPRYVGPGTAVGAGEPAPPASPYAPGAVSPQAYAPPPAPRPRDPRKKGPVLFSFVIAGSVLAVGILASIDLSGVDVPASAYPALITAVATLGLLLGAFWGRAGGLIAVTVLGLTATGVVGLAERAADPTTFAPPTAAQVEPSYTTGAGDMIIDLSAVQDPQKLAGRTVQVRAGLARIIVVVPDQLSLRIHATVNGPGAVNLLGVKSDGVGLERTSARDVPAGAGTLSLDLQLGVGDLEVITPADYRAGNYAH